MRDAIWESPILGLRYECRASFFEILRATSTYDRLIQTPFLRDHPHRRSSGTSDDAIHDRWRTGPQLGGRTAIRWIGWGRTLAGPRHEALVSGVPGAVRRTAPGRRR